MTVSSIPYAPPVINRHAAIDANRLKIKQASGQFLSLDGFNFGPEQYIQFHEGATINGTTGPADADVPLFVIKVAASAPFSWDSTFKFTGALWVCNSTTKSTLTAGAADCAWLANEL